MSWNMVCTAATREAEFIVQRNVSSNTDPDTDGASQRHRQQELARLMFQQSRQTRSKPKINRCQSNCCGSGYAYPRNTSAEWKHSRHLGVWHGQLRVRRGKSSPALLMPILDVGLGIYLEGVTLRFGKLDNPIPPQLLLQETDPCQRTGERETRHGSQPKQSVPMNPAELGLQMGTASMTEL